MCILTIKKDKNLDPLRAKSRIVVLGNHEEQTWTKAERFAPVFCSDSLRYLLSLSIEQQCHLKQSGVHNAFWDGVLPPDKITIVRPPPIGDPTAVKHEF